MKAVLCRQFGPPESLVVEDLPSPRPGDGEGVANWHTYQINGQPNDRFEGGHTGGVTSP